MMTGAWPSVFRLFAQRLLVTALVIAVTSMVAFSLVHLSGDPAVAMAGENCLAGRC